MSTLLLQLNQFFFTFYYSFCTVSNPLFTNYKQLVYLLYSRGQQCSYIQFIKLILYSVIKVVVKVTFSLLSFSCWVKSLIFFLFFLTTRGLGPMTGPIQARAHLQPGHHRGAVPLGEG